MLRAVEGRLLQSLHAGLAEALASGLAGEGAGARGGRRGSGAGSPSVSGSSSSSNQAMAVAAKHRQLHLCVLALHALRQDLLQGQHVFLHLLWLGQQLPQHVPNTGAAILDQQQGHRCKTLQHNLVYTNCNWPHIRAEWYKSVAVMLNHVGYTAETQMQNIIGQPGTIKCTWLYIWRMYM